MLSQQKAAELVEAGEVEQISMIIPGLQVVKPCEAGLPGNIQHQCQVCGKFFDKYIKVQEGTAICEYCVNKKTVRGVAILLKDDVEKVIGGLGLDTVIREKVLKEILKLIRK